jgi:hypothetical protein
MIMSASKVTITYVSPISAYGSSMCFVTRPADREMPFSAHVSGGADAIGRRVFGDPEVVSGARSPSVDHRPAVSGGTS